jgi:glycosyltransferase involved in cell wall biosynthesis
MICIPTFRRPTDLGRLLGALPESISVALQRGLCEEVTILVIDNDPEETARAVVQQAPVAVDYVVESRRGVAAVRNRALDEAAGRDVVVFIDDDETPADSEWLALLLDTRTSFAAHAVAGPVRTVTEAPLDSWIIAGGFFARSHRRMLRTGTEITRAATNNLLLDMRIVAEKRLRFDERFGLTGGEDSLFTSQLHAAGAKLVWCAEAAVLDHLLPERQTREHATRRARGAASADVRVSMILQPHALGRVGVRIRALGRGVLRGAQGLGLSAAGLIFQSERLSASGNRACARSLGEIEAVFGRSLSLYGGTGAGAVR